MTHSQSVRRIMVCLVVAPLLAGTALGADEKAPVGIEPKAQEVVRRLSDYLHGLKGFRVNATLAMKMTAPGMRQEVVSAYVLSARRPNKLAMVLKDSVVGITIVSDGMKLSTYVPMEGKYRTMEAPKDLSGVELTGSMVGPPIFGAPTFSGALLQSLLADKPYDALMEDVKAARHTGTEDVGGATCDRLEFSMGEWSWLLWVQTGDKPLIRKAGPNLPEQLARMAKGMPGISKVLKLDAAMTFDNWALDGNLPDEVFTFTPPEGVTLTEASPGREAEAPSPLLGKPAPSVKLDLLDGGKFDLASYKDKNIVILDFWATWCGPCQMSMPVLIDVAKEYKDKGVLLFAADVQEDPETIRGFLQKKQWAITVPLDKTGSVGETFGAETIPFTVIIGKDGTVQAIHNGFAPDMKAKLKRELDALLAGKALAPKK